MRFVIGLLLLAGCGYRTVGCEHEGERLSTISVPYVAGDGLGLFTNELIKQLSGSGCFHYVRCGGDLLLNVELVDDKSDRIGYRYNQDGTHTHLTKDLIGIENRRSLSACITLCNPITQEIICGPTRVSASVDLDYDDFNSIRDLALLTPSGKRESTLDFSLGQLDSEDGATDSATTPLYRNLARRIVESLLAMQ